MLAFASSDPERPAVDSTRLRALMCGAVAACGMLMLCAQPAGAMVVVDQSFLETSPAAGFALAEGSAYIGQTVTVGVTGQLTAVELNVVRRSDFLIPWVLDIQEVVAGLPTGIVLSSVIIPADAFPVDATAPSTNAPLSLSVALNAGIPFQAGDQFAIVLHPDGITGSPGLNAGEWGASTGYPGGDAVSGPDPNSLAIHADPPPTTFDLHFRTHMLTVPEPASGSCLMAALFAAALWRRHHQLHQSRSDKT